MSGPILGNGFVEPWDQESHGFLFTLQEEVHECEYETLELEEARVGQVYSTATSTGG